MKPQTFFNHFEGLTDAPNSVARLRELVLQLAVQGRLVEQDESDEPAARLLERIEAERRRLVREKKIREAKPLPPVSDDEKPFALPNGWTWTRFGEVATIASNLVQPDAYWDYLHVAPDNIEKQTGRLLVCRTVKEDEVKSANHLFYSGQIVYSKIRPNLAKATIVDFDGLCSADMYPINAHIDVQFLLKYMLSSTFLSMAVKSDTRVAMPKINQDELNKILVTVPPLEEQKRIVAKVDELMRLCDELERAQGERREARQRINRAALDQLLAADDVAEFQARWQTVSDHFPTLTAAPDQIGKLRQTILQLAVLGKLTRQDPRDEPAPALLRRIRAEHERPVKEKKIKNANTLPPVNPDEAPFTLPSGWTWARFPELGEFGRGKSKHRPRNDPTLFSGGKYPFIQTGDIARANGIVTTYIGLYNDHGLAQSRMWAAGTLCITIAANIADAAILGFDACFPDSVVGFVPSREIGSAEFFLYFMETAKHELESFAPSTAQKNINLNILERLLIPLPPLEEQKRIVAVVDRLMALCDELEAGLRRAEDDGERLLRVAVRALLTSTTEGATVESAAALVR